MVTSGLSALIRDAAAQAARDARQKYDNEHVNANDHARMLRVVDAVTAVVEPAMQARVAELEGALTKMLGQDLPGRVWDDKVRALLGLPAPSDAGWNYALGDGNL